MCQVHSYDDWSGDQVKYILMVSEESSQVR
jgi:hypothetical protein